MKKMNKKGFTLIELLAVIVILAIIMVIAVPQILDIIDNSRKSAWESNIKLIEEGIELAKTTNDFATTKFDISTVCTAEGSTSINDSVAAVVDISSDDMTITCAGKGIILVTPKGQFSSQKAIKIDCSGASCTDDWSTQYTE